MSIVVIFLGLWCAAIAICTTLCMLISFTLFCAGYVEGIIKYYEDLSTWTILGDRSKPDLYLPYHYGRVDELKEKYYGDNIQLGPGNSDHYSIAVGIFLIGLLAPIFIPIGIVKGSAHLIKKAIMFYIYKKNKVFMLTSPNKEVREEAEEYYKGKAK